ncbi:hypothetical protein PoB_005327500 [Plakobranchus ocellatus]|uniref:CCHC-type domain-containing protein n=1 Tax=Plakobranchus ocellatus TaxID=259542 RepID=A0AAV4C273_9GAST|nr:hypothetical protein PoB_005327500 [Plakobranchus ocellatus]
MDFLRPCESEKRLIGSKLAGEHKTSSNYQRFCFKSKGLGHIARDCTYSSPAAKKAGAGVIVTAPRAGARQDTAARTGLLWR